jgi:hypothetical protein
MVGCISVCLICRMTWANQGFIMDGRWSKRFSSQVYQLIRPPFLQPRACYRAKQASQPSQTLGRSNGWMP